MEDALGSDDTVNTYTWNAESEMSSSDSTVNYTYDGDRLEKSDGKMYWYGAGASPSRKDRFVRDLATKG